MNAVRTRASLSPKTVTKISRDEINQINKRSRKGKTLRATKVKTVCWSDGVDPRIVAQVKAMKIKPAFIKVVSSTEIIICNNPVNGKLK